jgi:two-component system, cell cycle response regulator CpdR
MVLFLLIYTPWNCRDRWEQNVSFSDARETFPQENNGCPTIATGRAAIRCALLRLALRSVARGRTTRDRVIPPIMTNSPPTKSHILIVEDDIHLRNVIAAALVAEGHSVDVARSGQAAASFLRTQSFDLIITDVIMPEGDGLELIMDLHASKNLTPILAITGVHAFTEVYLRTAKALGASRVLAKPFQLSTLLDATRDVVGCLPRGMNPKGNQPSVGQANRGGAEEAAVFTAA